MGSCNSSNKGSYGDDNAKTVKAVESAPDKFDSLAQHDTGDQQPRVIPPPPQHQKSQYHTTDDDDNPENSNQSQASMPLLHSDLVFTVCSTLSPTTFLSSGEDSIIYRYTMNSSKPHDIFKGHTKSVNKVVYAPMSGHVYSASRDKSIREWEFGNPTSLQVLNGHTLSISALDVNPVENGTLVSGSRDYSVRFWDVHTGVFSMTTKVDQNVVTGLKWLGNGDACVLQSSEDLSLRLWDSRTRKQALVWQDGPDFALSCDVSPSGTYFITSHNGFGGVGCHFRLWDKRKNSTYLRQCNGHMEAVSTACFIHDGTDDTMIAASGSKDHTIRIWDFNVNESTENTANIPSSANVNTVYVENAINVTSLAYSIPDETSGGGGGGGGGEGRKSLKSLICAGTAAGFLSYWELRHSMEDWKLVFKGRTATPS